MVLSISPSSCTCWFHIYNIWLIFIQHKYQFLRRIIHSLTTIKETCLNDYPSPLFFMWYMKFSHKKEAVKRQNSSGPTKFKKQPFTFSFLIVLCLLHDLHMNCSANHLHVLSRSMHGANFKLASKDASFMMLYLGWLAL